MADEMMRETLEDILGLNLLNGEPTVKLATTKQLCCTKAGLAEMRSVVLHHWRTSHELAANRAELEALVQMSPRELRETATALLLGDN